MAATSKDPSRQHVTGELPMAKASATKRRIAYSVHPAVEYLQAIVANLPEKTGHSLDEWIALTKKARPKEEA
jgi:hypothetical protein